MYYAKLRDNLYVDIDYPNYLTKLIGEAASWSAFCALPADTKRKFAFPGHQKDADPGYQLRSRKEGREDKEYFHIYPNVPELIRADGLADEVAHDKALTNFFAYGVQVQDKAHELALSIGREIGKQVPELAELINAGNIRSVLRLLHYTDQEDIIAAQHFDRSLYTLHLYESGPGLEFLDWDMKWKPAPIGNGTTVVFTGFRGEQLSKGKLQKTWHRVVRKDGVRDRISMVLFVWTNAVEDYDREGRSQSLVPSYNRDIVL